MSYEYIVETFVVRTTENDIHFQHSHSGLYYHTYTPGNWKIYMVHIVEWNAELFTNLQVTDAKKSKQAYSMAVRPPPPHDFEHILHGNMIKKPQLL